MSLLEKVLKQNRDAQQMQENATALRKKAQEAQVKNTKQPMTMPSPPPSPPEPPAESAESVASGMSVDMDNATTTMTTKNPSLWKYLGLGPQYLIAAILLVAVLIGMVVLATRRRT